MDKIKHDSIVGWIGTGVMGQSMCGHLIDRGLNVRVYSRTKSKLLSLVRKGAQYLDSPAQIATKCDLIFTMLGFPNDVRDVYFGKTGVFSTIRSGTILVDMTTTEPKLAGEIYLKAKELSCHSLDAPVSGGDIGAKEARLSIMVGGEREIFNRVKPLFEIMGKNIVLQGLPGSGQHTKMANQLLIATGMIGLCEALLYAHKAGLDLNLVLEAVASGAAGSWSLSNYGPRMIKNTFDPGFYVDHFIKDLGIVLREAESMNLALPGLALAHQLYVSLRAKGHGSKGTHALILALSDLSYIDWINRDHK